MNSHFGVEDYKKGLKTSVYFAIKRNVDMILDKLPCYELEIENIKKCLENIKDLCIKGVQNDN